MPIIFKNLKLKWSQQDPKGAIKDKKFEKVLLNIPALMTLT